MEYKFKSVPYDRAVPSGSSEQSVPYDQTIPSVQIKERFGEGLLNTNGIAVAKPANTPDSLYADYEMDPKTDTVVPVYGDARDTFVPSIEVLVNGVRIPKSMYHFHPLTLGLHFTGLAITGVSRVQVSSQRDNNSYEVMEGVLILPSSKEIPFGRLHEFAPVLFEKISANHILKYKSNERFIDKIIGIKNNIFIADEVLVVDYKILPRGIYATVKYYID